MAERWRRGWDSTGEFLLYRYLASVTSPKEVNIISLAPPEMVISLVRGDIDAFAWLAPFTTRAISSGKDIKLISNAKGLANNRIIMNVTKTFRDQHPDQVTKVLKAVQKAIDFTNANPEEATKIWAPRCRAIRQSLAPGGQAHYYGMKLDDGFFTDMNELGQIHDAKGCAEGSDQLVDRLRQQLLEKSRSEAGVCHVQK